MDDRNEEVFAKYDLRINNTYRARGALLLDTDRGLKLYGKYGGSKQHIENENKIKQHLIDQGYKNVDQYIPNKEGEWITENSHGEKMVIRDWFQGEECSLKEKSQAEGAAKNLAVLHKKLKGVKLSFEEKGHEDRKLTEVFGKHNRELKRVRSYIIEKKQKNEFEICFLDSFESFYQQGKESERLLALSEYERLMKQAEEEELVCHGAYNYHNVLMTRKGIATTNFDKSGIGVQVLDLYGFLRKAMEKNNWNLELGLGLIESYQRERSLSKQELQLLYILMLYPEKFWKITNYYFNNKKSWISARNIQKLVSLKEQEKQKKFFLHKLREYCIIKDTLTYDTMIP